MLHVQSVIAACAQTLYSLHCVSCASMGCVMAHYMISSVQSASQNPCMHASNAWWRFSNANDRQKIFSFIRRCIRIGFCSPDLADLHHLYISSDEKLFNKILTCPNHIIRTLLPPSTAQNYSLRSTPRNRQLPDRISRITDCNFTVRTLYRNMYWFHIFEHCALFYSCAQMWFDSS